MYIYIEYIDVSIYTYIVLESKSPLNLFQPPHFDPISTVEVPTFVLPRNAVASAGIEASLRGTAAPAVALTDGK